MSPVQDYQRYRLRRNAPGVRVTRWVLWLVIVVLVFIIGRALFTRSTPATNDPVTTNDQVNVNASAATDVNGNVNASTTNVNEAPATTTSSLTTDDCQTPISQLGSEQQVALTFGASNTTTGLDHTLLILREEQAPASVFVTGAWVRKFSEQAKQIVAAGLPLYNGGDSLVQFPELTAAEIAEQLTTADAVISGISGSSTKPYFRPPYGDTSDASTTAIREAGYCSILWTVDALDWQSGQTPSASQQRVLDRLRPGAIVLLQLGNDVTPQFLRELIRAIRADGYTIVPLATLAA